MQTETATAPLPHDHQAPPKAAPHRIRTASKPKPRAPRGSLLVLPSARLAEGRRLREFRAELTAHVGGAPTATQRALIDRATVLQHHLTTLDRKMAEAEDLSDHASRRYLAWSNTLARTLVRLGLEAARPPPQTPQQALAAIHAMHNQASP